MPSFGYTEIGWTTELGWVWLVSTESQIVAWFSTEVKKLAPNCAIQVAKPSSGETYHVEARRVKPSNRSFEIAIWAIRHLGLKGWEPFSSDPHPGFRVCLKLRSD
jgi:hypothetical protein